MGKMLLRHWTYWASGMSGKSSFSHTFVKAPMERFFLNKIFKRVAYENIKLKDGCWYLLTRTEKIRKHTDTVVAFT
jgi:hypothetical protein